MRLPPFAPASCRKEGIAHTKKASTSNSLRVGLQRCYHTEISCSPVFTKFDPRLPPLYYSNSPRTPATPTIPMSTPAVLSALPEEAAVLAALLCTNVGASLVVSARVSLVAVSSISVLLDSASVLLELVPSLIDAVLDLLKENSVKDTISVSVSSANELSSSPLTENIIS